MAFLSFREKLHSFILAQEGLSLQGGCPVLSWVPQPCLPLFLRWLGHTSSPPPLRPGSLSQSVTTLVRVENRGDVPSFWCSEGCSGCLLGGCSRAGIVIIQQACVVSLCTQPRVPKACRLMAGEWCTDTLLGILHLGLERGKCGQGQAAPAAQGKAPRLLCCCADVLWTPEGLARAQSQPVGSSRCGEERAALSV